MILPTNDGILIIGAGCFGASAAYHLLQRGYTDVTLIDRSPVLPAPDAASNDINRIVRTSYADKFYAELAREAIAAWKDKKWGDTYHEYVLRSGATLAVPHRRPSLLEFFSRSGVLVLGSSAHERSYTDEAYVNDVALGASVRELADESAIRSAFPAHVRTGRFDGHTGYLNYDGGWANAGQGLKIMLDEVKALKGKIMPGKNVVNIVRGPDGRSTGVRCDDNTVIEGSQIIIATGSWTPYAFHEQLDLGSICLATGQCIATIQLTPEESDVYRRCPVVVDFASGFYVFPPNEDNIVKIALHAAGFTHFVEGNSTISTPRTVTTDSAKGLHIPRSALEKLRKMLKEVYPDLAEKDFLGTRLCWYNDSPDGDWVISRYPGDECLILATAGSGHAYKFLPVIGGLIAGLYEDKLNTELMNKFRIDRRITQVDASRSGHIEVLDLNTLNTSEDLQHHVVA